MDLPGVAFSDETFADFFAGVAFAGAALVGVALTGVPFFPVEALFAAGGTFGVVVCLFIFGIES